METPVDELQQLTLVECVHAAGALLFQEVGPLTKIVEHTTQPHAALFVKVGNWWLGYDQPRDRLLYRHA